MVLTEFITSVVLYIIPLYLANSSAMVFGGGTPIDFGRNSRDGKRILGDGKTWRGAAAAIAVGTAVSALIWVGIPEFGLPEILHVFTDNYILFGFLVSVGAVAGDLTASFFKRRNQIPQGTPVLFLDQLDFVIGGLIVASVIYIPGFYELVFIAIATLVIHKLTNYLAFKLRIKKVPW